MATPRRIPPILLSTIYRASSDVYNPALRSIRAAATFRAYHPTRRRTQDQIPQQRYGTANEPPPPSTGDGQEMKMQTRLPKIGEKLQQSGEAEVKTDAKERDEQPSTPAAETPTTVDGPPPLSHISDPMLGSSDSVPAAEQPPPASAKPIATYLNTIPSASDPQATQTEASEDHAEDHADKTFDEHAPPIKAPHLDQPRYVHHFDTYGLVRKLMTESRSTGDSSSPGWEQNQAITVMKAVRLMLADNTDLAKDALVSKSQLENEAYLFKAACAELKTEVMARRKSEQEKLRTERSQLQHEVDIISQRLGQESASMKDELKGLFDDRKMAVRNEQRDMERQISQLNYKITVELQADARSEIEGLRLVMTRRVILTLVVIVGMVFVGLKLVADATKAEEEGRKRAKPASTMVSKGTQSSESGGFDEEGRRSLVPGEVVVGREGEGPGFVSLG